MDSVDHLLANINIFVILLLQNMAHEPENILDRLWGRPGYCFVRSANYMLSDFVDCTVSAFIDTEIWVQPIGDTYYHTTAVLGSAQGTNFAADTVIALMLVVLLWRRRPVSQVQMTSSKP
ncbi:hypothetical protein BT96DRAFT_994184 [Gymnopus androsaceus JB14]|uniref:Uncharacterized protein n=1 Tax=Gymnopus androsaceus JB14 TaxID=1447944 RepID=A0A6A4HNL5_9AGAR|nr:hypothetical protein BT96DRAFT_994184 [Gymnopus androsaceus JB14]